METAARDPVAVLSFVDGPHPRRVVRGGLQIVDTESGEVSTESCYLLTSLSPERCDPGELLSLFRSHWSVENSFRTYLDWPGQRQVVKVESWRMVKGEVSRQVRYAITSLGPHTPAVRLLRLVRGHWGIENRLHYVRDVTMGEDNSQVRTNSAPQVMAAVRNLVVSILRMRGEKNIAAAIRKIGWKPNAGLQLLGLMT